MLKKSLIGVLLGLAIGSQSAIAQNYTFNVQYFGGGLAALAPGSDNPIGQIVLPGESFVWIIEAQNGYY